ncbi:MAG: hypothetical protein ACYTEQ_28685, partial [Planctomycetota bacterium]
TPRSEGRASMTDNPTKQEACDESAGLEEAAEIARAKCRHADEYKAKRKPSCGCDHCREKWEGAQ